MNKIEKARKTIKDALITDLNFRQGYIANIAMLLYDNNIVRNYEKRNQIAEKIVKLIFY